MRWLSLLLIPIALSLVIENNSCLKNGNHTIYVKSKYFDEKMNISIGDKEFSCIRSKIEENYVLYKCNININLSDGLYDLKTPLESYTICIDNQPPTIEIGGQYINVSNNYCFYDFNPNINVKDNGCCEKTDLYIYYNGELVKEITKPGFYIIKASDKAGNTIEQKLNICFPETNKPTIKLIDYKVGTNINATFYVKDDSLIKEVSYCNINPIKEGYINCSLPKQETVTMTVTDIYNNSYSETFVFDIEPPTIKIIDPIPIDNTIYLNASKLEVSLLVSPDTKKCWLGNQELPIVNNIVKAMFSDSGDYTIVCEDEKGNKAQKTLHVIVDTIPPELNIIDYGYNVDDKGVYAYIRYTISPDAYVKVYKNGVYLQNSYSGIIKDYNVFVGQKYVYTLEPIDYANNKGESKEVVIYIKSDKKCKLDFKILPKYKYHLSKNVKLLIETEPKAFVTVTNNNNVVCIGNANEAGTYLCNVSLTNGENKIVISSIDPTGDKAEKTIVLYKDDLIIYLPSITSFEGKALIVYDNKIEEERSSINFFGFYTNNVKVDVYASNKLVCSNYQKPLCEKRNNIYFIANTLSALATKYKTDQIKIKAQFGDLNREITVDLKRESVSLGKYSIALGGALLPFFRQSSENILLFALSAIIVFGTALVDLRRISIELPKARIEFNLIDKIKNLLSKIRKDLK
ncbi:NEQ259 [Nanoarchaeum equitans Kin4-M]|uniref:NEQ259 n=1 Tax=Nanoarchaeum equitans (strain Kin4-M) TaxID=228908 RepID=Q74MT0_NANEQ|nr:NEQ259 [Nanoarchaeum equitans Kin4-M]